MKTYYTGPNYTPYYNVGIAVEMQETYNRHDLISFFEDEILPYTDAKLVKVNFEDELDCSHRFNTVVPYITVKTTASYYFDSLEILEKTISHDILIEKE